MTRRRARLGLADALLPVALIAVGALWLLVQIGFVPQAVVTALWRYWSVLLIGVGLDLLVPRTRPLGLPFTALAALLLALAAVLLPQRLAGPTGETAFEAPLGETRSLDLRLDLASAPADLTAAAAPDVLLQARADAPPATFTLQGSRDAVVRVRPAGTPPRLFGPAGRWSFAVTDAVPVTLEVDGGSGTLAFDLERVQLSELRADLGSGASEFVLPGAGRSYRATLDLGSGASRVRVAGGASVDLELDAASGTTVLAFDPGSDARVRLHGGSGSLLVEVPDDAPVRLEVRDDGSGRLDVGGALRRRSGSGDTGVWVTDALDGGGRVLDLRIEDAGSGPITVR